MNLILSLINKYIAHLKKSGKPEYGIRNTNSILLNFFKDVKTDFKYLTTQDMILAYEELDLLSTDAFRTYKTTIINFLRWTDENGHPSQHLVKAMQEIRPNDVVGLYKTYAKSFFKDLDDLLNILRFADKYNLDTFRCGALLVWCGINVEDLIDILKTDLDEDNNTIIHPITKEPFQIPPIVTAYLSNYRDKTVGCKPSDYLFRNSRSAHLTVARMIKTSSNANRALVDICPKTFKWTSIYLSGLYYRIHEYEKGFGAIAHKNLVLFENIQLTNAQYEMLKQFFGNKPVLELREDYVQYLRFKNCMYR